MTTVATVTTVTTDAAARSTAQDRAHLRDAVRAFVAAEVLPQAARLDEPVFPHDLLRRLGALGLLGLRYPVRDGGQGGDTAATTVLYEELAAGSLPLAAVCAMQGLMGTEFLHRFGTPEQHAAYLRPALAGTLVAGFALTEPDAGSDLGAMRTRARRDGDGWVLDGAKTWVTNGPVAGVLTVAARTGDGGGLDDVALFLVDTRTPGLRAGPPIGKLGVRSALTSDVVLEGCRLGPDALLGGLGDGARLVGGVLAAVRVMTASLAVGLARRALDDAVAFAGQRVAFGRPIGEHQAVQHRLADMAVSVHAARLVTAAAADALDDRARDAAHQAAMAKLFATEACASVVDGCTRVLGSAGFADEYGAQRYFRDARFLLYGGGTSELLRSMIGRTVLRGRTAGGRS